MSKKLDVMAALAAGWWVPTSYGNRFQVFRLTRGADRIVERGEGVYVLLVSAKAECERANGAHRQIEWDDEDEDLEDDEKLKDEDDENDLDDSDLDDEDAGEEFENDDPDED